MNRRECLNAGAAGALAAALSSEGCNQVRARVAPLRDTTTRRETPPFALPVSPVASAPTTHLLNRAGFGPTLRDRARVEAIGTAAWLDEQFSAPNDDSGEPSALILRLRPIDALNTVAPADLEDLGEQDVLYYG